jgi:hypothetical protein
VLVELLDRVELDSDEPLDDVTVCDDDDESVLVLDELESVLVDKLLAVLVDELETSSQLSTLSGPDWNVSSYVANLIVVGLPSVPFAAVSVSVASKMPSSSTSTDATSTVPASDCESTSVGGTVETSLTTNSRPDR